MMKLVSVLLGTVLALGLAGVADAAQPPKTKPQVNKTQEATSSSKPALLDGSNVDEILDIAKNYGDADLEEQSNGDPKIKGSLDGVGYAIYFMNCTDNKDCEDLNFYAGFLDLKPDADTINEWNKTKRFGKAYLDNDGDAVVEMDLNLEHGVSAENLDADMGVWQLVVAQYADHIGYEKAK